MMTNVPMWNPTISRSSIMKRSERRILTTHAGRLPNPTNIREILTARVDDPEQFDALMQGGVADMVRKQVELKNDIHSDGEFWKARDQMYYDRRHGGRNETGDRRQAGLAPCPPTGKTDARVQRVLQDLRCRGEYPDARRDDPAGDASGSGYRPFGVPGPRGDQARNRGCEGGHRSRRCKRG